MRPYTEIVAAVRDGTPVTEEELRFTLTFAHYHLMQLYFQGTKAVAAPDSRVLDGLDRRLKAFTTAMDRDLDTYLRGSSMEPGLSQAERQKRFSKTVSETGARLWDVLNSVSKNP